MVLIPTPGQSIAVLEPGNNLAAWIDSKFLPGYLWQKTWDPEGLLSTLPAVASGITGLLAGQLILGNQTNERKAIYLFSFGFLAFVTGYFWNYDFPFNKSLWTSSFVMATSELAAMVLGVSMFIVDVLGRTRFMMPEIIFGSNAIAVYVLTTVWRQPFYVFKFGGASLNNHFMQFFESKGWGLKLGSFLFALVFICFNFIPAWLLYRKKIFIKL